MAWAALLKSAGSKAAMQSGKKMATNIAKEAAVNKVKSVVKNKKKKGKDIAKKMLGGGGESSGGGGALAIRPSSSIVSSPAGALVPFAKGDEGGGALVVSNSAKDLGLTLFMESVVGVKESLKSIKESLNANSKDAEKRLEKQRLLNATLKKGEREEDLETKKPKPGSGIGKKIMEPAKDAAGNFLQKLKRFFESILLGMLVNGLVGGARDVVLAFRVGIEAYRKGMPLLRKGVKSFTSGITNTFKTALKPLESLGRVVQEALEGIGSKLFGWVSKSISNITQGIKNFGKNIVQGGFKAAQNIGRTVGNVGKNVVNFAAKKLPNVAKNVTRAKNFLKTTASKAKNIVKTVGSKAKNIAKPVLSKVGKAAKPVLGKVSSIIGKLFGKNAAKAAAGPGIKSLFKILAKGAKAIKIPVVGPLLVAIMSMFSGDPIGKTLFKTVGTAIGGGIGLALPLPVPGNPLSMMAGELIGEYMGNMLYILFKGGGIEAVGAQLKKDLLAVFNVGKNITKWIAGGIGRYVKNIITTDPLTIPEGGGRRAVATRVTKFLGLYDWLKTEGFAGGKDGQIDKFPNFLNVLFPWRSAKILVKSFFPPSEGGEEEGTSASIGSQKSNSDGEDVSESASYEDGAEEDTTVVVDGGGGEQASAPASQAGQVKFIPLDTSDSSEVLNTLTNATLYKT